MRPDDEPEVTLALWDWRRRMHELGAEVRRRQDQGQHLEAWHRWRTVRDEMFASHPQSPVPADERGSFPGLAYFEHDPRYRIEAELYPVGEEVLQVAHSADGRTPFRRFAQARFELHSESVSLSLYWLDAYGGGVFLPFRDLTSGTETYGGGRYLLDTVKGADLGHVGTTLRLDLNFAYHPSCVYSPRWSCPLAPPDNHLPVPVRAGERLPDGTPGRDGG